MVAEQMKVRTTGGQARVYNVPDSQIAVSPAAPRAVTANRRLRAERRAGARKWRSPMTATVLIGTFLVSLLCCYVYEYARVAAAGFEQSVLLRELRTAKQEGDALHAEISRLSLASTVEARAQRMGMVPAPPEAAEVLPLTVRAPQPARRRAVAQTGN